jgi:hypothetical protein
LLGIIADHRFLVRNSPPDVSPLRTPPQPHPFRVPVTLRGECAHYKLYATTVSDLEVGVVTGVRRTRQRARRPK